MPKKSTNRFETVEDVEKDPVAAAELHASWRKSYGLDSGIAGRYALVYTTDDMLYESSDWEIRDGWFQGIFSDHKWLIPANRIVKILSFQERDIFQRYAVIACDNWLRDHEKQEEHASNDMPAHKENKRQAWKPRKPQPKPPVVTERIGTIGDMTNGQHD